MSKPEEDARSAGTPCGAAVVDPAGEEFVRTLGLLAASPLTEQAAARMRRVLARAGSPAGREVLRRLRMLAATVNCVVLPVAPAGGSPCRSPRAQPVTGFGPGRPGVAVAGAW